MTVSLLSTSIALAIGLPIFALGERFRERKERRLGGPHTSTHPKGHLMSRYDSFTRVVHDQRRLETAYHTASPARVERVLLEDGDFVFSAEEFGPRPDPGVELYLGDGAWLEVRDGLTANVHLTLPEEYVEALDQAPVGSDAPRRLYWSSPVPPHGLDEPTQNPFGYGDVTLYVPESLEPAYREKGFSEWGTPSRRYLEIWEGYEPPTSAVPNAAGESEAVESPSHYTWLGQSLAALGLSDAANVESWDVLDAAFPLGPSPVELRQVPAEAGPQGRRGEAPGGLAQGEGVPRPGDHQAFRRAG